MFAHGGLDLKRSYGINKVKRIYPLSYCASCNSQTLDFYARASLERLCCQKAKEYDKAARENRSWITSVTKFLPSTLVGTADTTAKPHAAACGANF